MSEAVAFEQAMAEMIAAEAFAALAGRTKRVKLGIAV